MRSDQEDEIFYHVKKRRFEKSKRTSKYSSSWSSGRPGTRIVRPMCIVQMSYSSINSKNQDSLKAHLKYATREASQNRQIGSCLSFGSCSSDMFKRVMPREKRFFKIILSPEELFSLDVENFTRRFVTNVLRQCGIQKMGQTADWFAVVHTNTSHPHIHLLIRGLDVKGKDLYFSKETIRRFHLIATSVVTVLSIRLLG